MAASFTSATSSLGWGDFFAAQLGKGETRWARVVEEQKRYHFVADPGGTFLARISGKLRHAAAGRAELPAVGDFVVVTTREREKTATIDRVLTRKSKLSRKTSGSDQEQILCSNVDIALVVHGLDTPPNLRRIERFITMARTGGVTPVVVLSKADLAAAADGDAIARAQLPEIAAQIRTITTSSRTGAGLPELRDLLRDGVTAVLVGPSGAGKSALINALAGNQGRSTGDVRDVDGKGRHTTTARSMVALPGGGLIIDTPGIRELELWQAERDIPAAFDDIAAVAVGCRFRDCRHMREPGCAVRAAIDRGDLDAARVAAFVKLQTEAAAQQKRRRDRGAAR